MPPLQPTVANPGFFAASSPTPYAVPHFRPSAEPLWPHSTILAADSLRFSAEKQTQDTLKAQWKVGQPLEQKKLSPPWLPALGWTAATAALAAVPAVLTINPLAAIPGLILMGVAWWNLFQNHQRQGQALETLNPLVEPLKTLPAVDATTSDAALAKTLTGTMGAVLAPDKTDSLGQQLEATLSHLSPEQKAVYVQRLQRLATEVLRQQQERPSLSYDEVQFCIRDVIDWNQALTDPAPGAGASVFQHPLPTDERVLFSSLLRQKHRPDFHLSEAAEYNNLAHYVIDTGHNHWDDETDRNAHPVSLPMTVDILLHRLALEAQGQSLQAPSEQAPSEATSHQEEPVHQAPKHSNEHANEASNTHGHDHHGAHKHDPHHDEHHGHDHNHEHGSDCLHCQVH
ncbi:MAG: hypothetical protein SFZ03_03350 [Candidatus Melainabacteria bacterium]|nr:hypothetical protein [Candidatus Melainabacteria bacterium]